MKRSSHAARIEALERKLAAVEPRVGSLPLSAVELRELRDLERERERQFGTPIETWDLATCDAFMAHQASPTAARLDHLRRRAETPEERAHHRAFAATVDRMNAAELDELMAELTIAVRQEGLGLQSSVGCAHARCNRDAGAGPQSLQLGP